MAKQTVRGMIVVALAFASLVAVRGSRMDDGTWGVPAWTHGPVDVPANHQVRPGGLLVVRPAYEVLLENEDAEVYIGIKNLSDVPLKLLSLISVNTQDQLLFQARTGPDGENTTQPNFVPWWGRLASERFQEIGANEYVVFGSSDFTQRYSFFPPEANEIRVGLLTGPEEWLLSEWVPMRRLEGQRVEDAAVVGIVEMGTGDRTWQLIIRKARIGDDEYLFLRHRRIARVPPGARPRFEFNRERGNEHLIIHFDGVDVPPLVLLNEPSGWTPETAPHLQVLEDFKLELEEAGLK